MKHIALAVLLVAILATAASGQTERVPVTVDTPQTATATTGSVNSQPSGWQKAEQQVGTAASVSGPTEPTPAPQTVPPPPAPAWETRPRVEEAARRVLNGEIVGQPGRDGRNGKDGKTIIREGHRHPQSMYAMLRGQNIPGPAGYGKNGMNVPSGSYVDARDEATYQRSNAYTDGAIAGLNATRNQQAGDNATNKNTDAKRESDHNPWWLLWLIPLLILLGLLWRYWNAIVAALRRLLGRREKIEVEKPSGFNTNDVTLNLGGREIGSARVATPYRDQITKVKVAKFTRRPNEPSWRVVDENSPLCPEQYDEPIIDERRFRIKVYNDGNAVLPDDLVILTEALGEGWRYISRSCVCRINGGAEFRLDDRMVEDWLVNGHGLRMKEVVATVHIPNYKGGIPAHGTFAVEFSARMRDLTTEQGYAGTLVQAPQEILERIEEQARAEADAKAKVAADAEAKAKAKADAAKAAKKKPTAKKKPAPTRKTVAQQGGKTFKPSK